MAEPETVVAMRDMTHVEELVSRLRLGGPNAAEVGPEAADLISALQKRVGELETKANIAILDAAEISSYAETVAQRSYSKAIEDAARVAETLFLDATDTDWDEGVNTAKREIAKSIRALNAKPLPAPPGDTK